MKFTFKEMILTIMVLVTIVYAIFTYFDNTKKDKVLLELRNQIAIITPTEILVADSSAVRRLAIVEGNLSKLQEDWLDDQSYSLKEIKDRDEEIRSLLTLNARYTLTIDSLETRDSLIIDASGDTVHVRRFSIVDDEIRINGFFQTISPFHLTLEQMLILLRLNVIVAESKDKQWSGYVETTSERLSIEKIQVAVNPYKPSWKEKFALNIGASFGEIKDDKAAYRFGLMLSGQYGKNQFGINLDTFGKQFFYARTIKTGF